MIDRQGRLFGRINVLDFLVVLLVVALAARLAYSWLGPGRTVAAESDVPITFTALVAAVRGPTADAIHVGDAVYETRTNSYLGKVTAVKVEPSLVLVQNPDGTQTQERSTVYKDVYVTISGRGKATPTSVMVGTQQIHIGTALQFQTRIWGVTGTVWNIEVGGEGK
ncbi:MAG: DUF4330 domain-containing protein [Firmicutes bacterium]|nr:DUF4330 domain-containing protein [Bacillota bacterium]